MNNQAHEAQQYDVDFAPALRMYLESLENWKKNYETLLANAGGAPSRSGPDLISAGYEQAMASWQQTGGDAFKRLVEQQVELCRFFGRRWELYRDLPEKFAHCRTPADLAQLQVEFLNRMGTEYMQETTKLAQPMTEMVGNWPFARPIH